MNIRIYNARILTMQDNTPIFEGEIQITGNKIAYVGPSTKAKNAIGEEADVKDGVWDREIDACGNLVMPGFKNAHTHSAMTCLRSYADDLPLLDWLNKQIFPMEAKLTPEDIYELSRLAIMEYLTSGITANFDMYLTADTIAQASLDCGYRTVMCGGLNNFSQSFEELEEWYLKHNEKDSLVSFQLGFHAEYTNSKENLEKLAALSHKYQAPLSTHSSESSSEVDGCMERYGMTPTALFDKLGVFDYGGACFHCVHMTEEDLAILKKRNIYVVTNPASNAKLASGIAPIEDMLNEGIHVAIGTDGPASNNCLDMFREMFLVTALAKLRANDASALDANKVLRMATVEGAHAMGLANADSLAEGKLADLILIDLHQPNMQPINNISKNLVYSGSKQNVKMTMVNGKILYEDGKFHIGVKPETVYARANEIVARMKLL